MSLSGFVRVCFCIGLALTVARAVDASPSFDVPDGPEPAEVVLQAAAVPVAEVTPAAAEVPVGMAPSDSWASFEAPSHDQGVHGLAALSARLGTPAFVGQMLLAGYAAGQLFREPGLSAGSARVAGAVLAAAVLGQGLQLASDRLGVGFASQGWQANSSGTSWLASGDVTAEEFDRWVLPADMIGGSDN